MADWERLFEDCPGAVGGAAPRAGVWGYADVEEAMQFEAMQYLNDRGVKYLTLADSPVPRCVRLTFKGGVGTGYVQRKASKRSERKDRRESKE